MIKILKTNKETGRRIILTFNTIDELDYRLSKYWYSTTRVFNFKIKSDNFKILEEYFKTNYKEGFYEINHELQQIKIIDWKKKHKNNKQLPFNKIKKEMEEKYSCETTMDLKKGLITFDYPEVGGKKEKMCLELNENKEIKATKVVIKGAYELEDLKEITKKFSIIKKHTYARKRKKETFEEDEWL